MNENGVILTIQWKIADIVKAMTEKKLSQQKKIKTYLKPESRNL